MSEKVVVTKSKLDELANVINEKAGTTGKKTIDQLKETVSNGIKVSEPLLQQLSVTSEISWKRYEPEAPYVGFSMVDVGGREYNFDALCRYTKAASSYSFNFGTIGSVEKADDIKCIYFELFNYDGDTPVTNAIRSLGIDYYDYGQTCSYSVAANSGTRGYYRYYDGVTSSKFPASLTVNANREVTLTLTSNALVPGTSTRLVFDTTLSYRVLFIMNMDESYFPVP